MRRGARDRHADTFAPPADGSAAPASPPLAGPMTPPQLTRLFLLAGLVALLASCATTSVTPVGKASYQPLPAASPVLVFSNADEVKKPFETLGIIDHNDPGKYQILTLGDAIPALQDKARAIGANAIVVDEVRPVKSGIISTGIHVRARAIRLQE